MACIGIVVPSLCGGGGVSSVARFVKNIVQDSDRFMFRLVSLSTSADDVSSLRFGAPSTWLRGSVATQGLWEGLPFVHVGAVGSELEFQRFRPRRALRDALSGCDLIQVVAGSPAWANAVLGLGKPVALQVATRARVERHLRDAHPQGFAGWLRKGMTELTDRLDDRALLRVDAIQVENPWMLEYSAKLNAGRVVDLRYAPPGVDARLFRPLDLRVPLQDPYILSVARFMDPRKNIGLLLESYAQLPETIRSKVRLVLAGSSGPTDAFWRRAELLGVRERITYVERPEMGALVRLYQEASVFALSSDEEGLGVVVLEAMACGVPVVSTRSGGPEGVISDGKDGYLVPLDDAAAISLRLAQLLRDDTLNVEMGRRARRTIERRFDERVAGEAFIDIWDRMVHNAGIG